MTKRVVFVHPDGLHQIMGLEDDIPGPLPVCCGPFEALGRTVEFASLFKATIRAAYYKEPMVPASYSFHEAQQ